MNDMIFYVMYYEQDIVSSQKETESFTKKGVHNEG